MIEDKPNLRLDGRKNFDSQEIFIQKAVNKNCTSSIYIETTHLKLLCSLIGPVYMSSGTKKGEDMNKMNVKVNINIPSYLNIGINKNSTELQLESLISQNIIAEKYFKTRIQINLDIYECNCDILPYAVMAVSLALNDANIEQKGIITCTKLVVNEGSIIVDPTISEEKQSELKLTFGCIVDLQENNLFIQQGTVDDDTFKKVIGSAINICEKYQNYLINKM